MAKSRDARTQTVKRIARANGVNPQTIAELRTAGRAWANVSGLNPDKAVYRSRGRRGIRARKRANRIADRKMEGTYRQPSGGDTTNS